MKKLLLFGSALMLSLGAANAQLTPGVFSNYFYDDCAQSGQYESGDGGGIYWYSGNATAVNGTRSTTGMTFNYATASAYNTISADLGTVTATGSKKVVDLSTMADIIVTMKNNNLTKDLVLRVYLKDSLDVTGDIEPNVSDCAGVTSYATTNSSAEWDGSNVVYPAPAGYPANTAVYPRKAYNGIVIPANTTKTFRIDLTSFAGAIGGRKTNWSGDGTPAGDPSTSAGPLITAIRVIEFKFNENVSFTLTDNAIDKGSYKYDAISVPSQNDWSGSVTFTGVQVGGMSALPDDPTTSVNDAAVIDNSLQVYPNPANGVLNVSFDAVSGADVTLSSVVGNKVFSATATAGTNEMTVNTTGYPSGVYILSVATEKGSVARKVYIK